MGRIDDSLAAVASIDDATERAFQLAGLISTLFKIRGSVLIVTGQLAYDIYANSNTPHPELELVPMEGNLPPRLLQEIMVGQLHAAGMISRWKVANTPVRFQMEALSKIHGACRDFTTEHGVVKLFPAEHITANRILAATYPAPDEEAETQARLLLINGLTEAFQMDWPVLQKICHEPEYRLGEELAKMRGAAKRDVDSLGVTPDPIGQISTSVESTAPATPQRRERPGDELANLY